MCEENKTFATMTKFAEIAKIASVIDIAIYNTYPHSMGLAGFCIICGLNTFTRLPFKYICIHMYRHTISVGLVY